MHRMLTQYMAQYASLKGHVIEYRPTLPPINDSRKCGYSNALEFNIKLAQMKNSQVFTYIITNLLRDSVL